MAMHIRTFSFEQDHQLCREAEAAANRAERGIATADDSDVEKSLFRLRGKLEGDRYWGFTAVEDGQPVGLVFVDTDFRDAQAFIDNIYVLPEQRRRDIGSQLMEHAMRFLRERGIRRVDLMVTAGNEAAVQLYKSLGYEVTRLRMSRVLSGDA